MKKQERANTKDSYSLYQAEEHFRKNPFSHSPPRCPAKGSENSKNSPRRGPTRLLLPPAPRTHALSWAAHNPAAAGFLSLPPLCGPQRLSNLIFRAEEAVLGASVAVPPPRPTGATAGRCLVSKRNFPTGKPE